MHNDKQNSVIALSDAVGNPVQRRAYGTYGETDPAQMVGNTAHPFGYTGRRWDPDLGLYYYRARWYDPSLGTFLQTDPIGSLDYINLYSYVGLEPGNGTDPTGMGRFKFLVETVNGIWKPVSERNARNSRKAGKNVDVDASQTGGRTGAKTARSIEESASGRANTTRHTPHPDGDPRNRGTQQPHYQPDKRPAGPRGRGHTFFGTAAATTSAALSGLADEIGTHEGNLKPNATAIERRLAQGLDFIDPASGVSEVLQMGADALNKVSPHQQK
jgi:RHS repeat-associated protein